MAAPLDIIGVDRPLGGSPSSPVQYQGGNILASANQSMERSLQKEAQSLQQRQQTQENISDAARQASQAETNASILEAQSSAARSKQSGVAGISEALIEFMKLQKEKEKTQYAQKVEEQVLRNRTEEATRKAASEAKANEEYQQAYTGLQNLKVNWGASGGVKKQGGIGELRYEGVKLLSSFTNLSAEQRMNLTKDLYGEIEKQNNTRLDTFTKEAEKQQLALKENTTVTFIAKAAYIAGELGESVHSDSTPILQRFNAVLSDVSAVKGLSEVDKLQIQTDLIKYIQPKLDKRNSAYYELEKTREAIQKYAPQMVSVMNDTSLTPEMKQMKLQALRIDLGVPTSFEDLKPGMQQEELLQQLERDKQIRQLQQNEIVEDAQALKMSYASQGYYAASFLTNPTLLQMAENNPLMKGSAGGQTAIQLAKDFTKDREQVQQLHAQYLNLSVDVQNLNKDNFIFWVKQNASNSPDIKDLIGRDAVLYGIVTKMNQGLNLTEDDKQRLLQVQQSIVSNTVQRAGILTQKINDLQSKYTIYGLDLNQSAQQNFETVKHRKAAVDTEIQAYNKALEEKRKLQQPQLGVQSPNPTNGSQVNVTTYDPKVNGGWMAPGVKTLYSVNFGGGAGSPKVKAVLPFSPADAAKLKIWEQGSGNGWGDGRAGRPKGSGKEHAGLDIAAPEGTKLHSYIPGRVVHAGAYDGYGYTVDILGDDGMIHRFAHLQAGSIRVRKGDRVQAGQLFGNVGNTGKSDGAHLHWEVRENSSNTFGFNGTVNPLEYVASLNGKDSTTPRPRGSGNGWDMKADTQTYRVPQNAVLLPGGQYYLNGKIGYINAPETKPLNAGDVYHPAKPMDTGHASHRATDYNNDPENTHNYKALKDDTQFRRKLSAVSDRLGIPAQWLADLIAFETSGTFSPSIPNAAGSGAVGLIQFMPETLKGMGYTVQQATSMSRVQQLDLVEKYLKPMKPYLNRGAEYVLMAVWGGAGNLKKLAEGKLDEGISDGSITFREYASRLGSHAGRRYGRNQAARRERLTSTVHTSYVSGCKTCEAVRQAGGAMIPHKSQNA